MGGWAAPVWDEAEQLLQESHSPRHRQSVVVGISGGTLQVAYSSDPDVQLVLVDWDTEGCTPDDDTGIVEITGENGRSRLARATEFPTVSIDQLMGTDTGRAMELAGIVPGLEPYHGPSRSLQVFDQYRYGPRSVLVPGDRFRATGGPVYVTDDGKAIPVADRGIFVFRRYWRPRCCQMDRSALKRRQRPGDPLGWQDQPQPSNPQSSPQTVPHHRQSP